MLTVPSSSMLISQPDSSTRRLMFLPPGPMRAPIFSGLILTWTMRGRVFAQFGARRGDGLGHFGQDVQAGDARFFQGFGHEVVREAAQLEVQLEAGDAVAGAGDFAIHVAEGVFPADDVGEEFVGGDFVLVVVFGADADADAGDGTGHGDAGIHQGEGARRRRWPWNWSRWIP